MLVVVNSNSISLADSSRMARELNYDGTTYVFESLKDALVFAIGKAKRREDIEGIVESIPLQPNGVRYQVANVLDDAFWYTTYSEITLDALKDWMIKRVLCYA